MHSWVFRHRTRLARTYGVKPTERTAPAGPDTPAPPDTKPRTPAKPRPALRDLRPVTLVPRPRRCA